jgi:hypothetical protein
VRGNIYVYNGGTVNVKGNIRIDSLHSASELNGNGTPLREEDGIIVYGADGVKYAQAHPGKFPGVMNITSPGSINIKKTNLVISGTANKIHLFGTGNGAGTGLSAPLVGDGAGSINAALSDGWLCDTRNHSTGECLHSKLSWEISDEGYTKK